MRYGGRISSLCGGTIRIGLCFAFGEDYATARWLQGHVAAGGRGTVPPRCAFSPACCHIPPQPCSSPLPAHGLTSLLPPAAPGRRSALAAISELHAGLSRSHRLAWRRAPRQPLLPRPASPAAGGTADTAAARRRTRLRPARRRPAAALSEYELREAGDQAGSGVSADRGRRARSAL